eukprot:5853895-Prymnesium_polylepis.1
MARCTARGGRLGKRCRARGKDRDDSRPSPPHRQNYATRMSSVLCSGPRGVDGRRGSARGEYLVDSFDVALYVCTVRAAPELGRFDRSKECRERASLPSFAE